MKPKSKNLTLYILLGIVIVLVIASILLLVFKPKLTSTANAIVDLSQYRAESIPQECRLPVYEDDLNWWKEHMGHHENTFHCLEYYKDV